MYFYVEIWYTDNNKQSNLQGGIAVADHNHIDSQMKAEPWQFILAEYIREGEPARIEKSYL